jgi:predicted unusual protein kinase regulating ubiquinone biosynthesis (AarF/ABC1/UbiB family)
MENENRLSQRLLRYAKVTSAVSGLAARLAGEKYLGIKIDRDLHAEDLKQVLGNLKGPLMKVAQILATVPDILPEEYALQLAELQSNAPVMGWFFVKRRMEAELGSQWRSCFQDFDETATAAASLGQVHKATLSRSNDRVACKLQYPDMKSIVEADLEQLKVLLSIYESFNKAIQTQNMYDEIVERMREELDYTLEAKHIRLFHYMLQDLPSVSIPTVYDDFSTHRLLTMSWLEGEKITSQNYLSQSGKNTLASTLFHAWYQPLYGYGIIHGDPHLGNYTVTPEGHVNLLDFGCIRIFKPTFVEGVIHLYQALKSNNRDLAHHAYTIWGFKNLSHELMDTLNLWARFLYEPLMDDRIRPIQEGSTGIYGKEVADKVHHKLQELGGVVPPKEFVFMDRAAVGIGSALMRLNAEQNWHRIFEGLIEGFTNEKLATKQSAALASCGMI